MASLFTSEQLRVFRDSADAAVPQPGGPSAWRHSGPHRPYAGGLGQQERIEVFTTLVGDGGLFYALGVAPRDGFSAYQATFRRVVGSIRLNDRDPSLE